MTSLPNVVLIVADDMGYGDFGVFSQGAVRTPTIDSLIGEGTCLTQHYAGSAVCSPSRAALLTGRYPIRTGAISPQETLGYDRIALDELTVADALNHGGYATGLIGKWHNGALDPRYHPNARGFDEFFGFRGGWMDYYDWWADRNGTVESGDGRYLTDVFTDEAVSFIERHANQAGGRFFLAVMYNAPHSPLQAPPHIVARYEEQGWARSLALTYAMVEVMDRGIARVLEALQQQGVADNTLVMVTSDNGPAFSMRADMVPDGGTADTRRFNCGFKGAKGSVYEGGIRVPMVLRWPDGLPGGGGEIDHLVHFIDWLPTLLEACGVARPAGKPLDGRSVLDVLRGKGGPSAGKRFWQWNGYSPIGQTNAAVRDGPWKLVRPVMNIAFASAEDARWVERYTERDIEYKYHRENVPAIADWPEPRRIVPAPPAPELYNIADDPLEQTDLAASHPARTERLLTELETWFEQVEAERQSKTADILIPTPAAVRLSDAQP